MALVTRARAAGILAISLLMLSAPGALALIPNYLPDAQIRPGWNPTYTGGGVFNNDASGQSVSNTGAVGQKLTFFIKMSNLGASNDSFKVRRSAGYNNGYRVRYYDAANNDVTGQVTTGSFTTPTLAHFGEYVMRATVKVRSIATACSSTSRLITVTSSNFPSAKDAVRFTARRATDLNCPPIAHDDANSITEDAVPDVVTGNVLANDTDPDGNTLQVSNAPFADASAWGVLIIYADGSYTYTAFFSALHYGCFLDDDGTTVETTQYEVTDGLGGTDIGSIAITIHGVTDQETCPL